MDNKRVFFSYSIDDRAFADELRNAMLADHHVQVWDPANNMAVGTKMEESIKESLSRSDLFVYIVPEKEGSGKWSLFELGAAKALGKKIVAVVTDSGRVANSSVAAKLADSLVVETGLSSPDAIARRILEKAA